LSVVVATALYGLTCLLSLPAILRLTAIATATGYVSTPSVGDVESVGWQLAYIIGIASVLGVLSWNGGSKLLGVTNAGRFRHTVIWPLIGPIDVLIMHRSF